MEPSKIRKIVGVLISDPNLLRNWAQFADALDIDASNITSLQEKRNRDITHYEIFKETITIWLSKYAPKTPVSKLCDILKELKFIKVAEELSEHSETAVVYFSIPQSQGFVGRKDQLITLEKYYKNNEVKAALICGLGGIGKTELAKSFANMMNQKHKSSCVWLNGDGVDNIRKSIENSAKKVSIPIPIYDENSNDIDYQNMILILEKLLKKTATCNSSATRLIIVIDNVDEMKNELTSVFKTVFGNKNVFLVVTSIKKTLLAQEAKLILIREFKRDESFDFLKNSGIHLDIGNVDNDSEINCLCHDLQHFPLALKQATAYIKYQQILDPRGYFIADYLKEFNAEKDKLLDYKVEDFSSTYYETTMSVWKVTINKIMASESGFKAINLLNMLAFVCSNSIRYDFLQVISQENHENENDFLKALKQLITYSLVTIEKRGFISIHKLVQWVILRNIEKTQEDTQIIQSILKALKTKALNRDDVGHVINVWRFALQKENLFKEFSKLSENISSRLFELKIDYEAMQFAELNYDYIVNDSGAISSDVLKAAFDFADTLKFNGKFSKALELYEYVYNNRTLLTSDIIDLGPRAAKQCANVVRKLGRFKEIRTWNKKALEGFVHSLNCSDQTNFSDSIKTRLHIGSCYSDLNHSKKAEDQFLNIIQHFTYTEKNVDVQRAKYKLFFLRMLLQRFESALEGFKILLQENEDFLGLDHPHTSSTRHQLGMCQLNIHDFSAAIETFRCNLEESKKHLSLEHPHILQTRYFLGICLLRQKLFAEAEKEFETIFKLTEDIFGKLHRNTIRNKFEYARSILEQNRCAEARDIFIEVLEIHKIKGLDIDSYAIFNTKFHIALSYFKEGQFETAKAEFESLLPIKFKTYREDQIDCLTTKLEEYVIKCLHTENEP